MSAVLGIVIRAITSFLIASAGRTAKQAQTGAVTLIQRFGSALNLNIHFHMLYLDGVYVSEPDHQFLFQPVKAPTPTQLMHLVDQISFRVGRHLERLGWLVRDCENSYFEWDAKQDSPLDDVIGHAITYRIAVGPHRGEKAFTLQTLPAMAPGEGEGKAAISAGFSLHAGIAARAHQRTKLERLCRHVTQPAVSTQRLSLTRQSDSRYTLKTPYRDGTTHVIFEPLDFIARLAAQVPRPRVNLTRYHGIFAPNSRWRAQITPAGRGKRVRCAKNATEPEKHRAMTWARRLKRVFKIDIETCEHCGGAVRIIACIEDPVVIRKILQHLKRRESSRRTVHEPRAPPQNSQSRQMN